MSILVLRGNRPFLSVQSEAVLPLLPWLRVRNCTEVPVAISPIEAGEGGRSQPWSTWLTGRMHWGVAVPRQKATRSGQSGQASQGPLWGCCYF